MIKARPTHSNSNPDSDLGFGTKASSNQGRLISREGSFNVRRFGLRFWERIDLYFYLKNISWSLFFTWTLLYYVVLNLLFTVGYVLLGVDELGGLVGTSYEEKLVEAFFFSTQTFTTIGYGAIHPRGMGAYILSSLEGMMGLLSFAVATGLVYARFARAQMRLVSSEVAVVAPYRSGMALMFRIANLHNYQLIDTSVKVSYSWVEAQPDGSRKRNFEGLKLERSTVSFFPTAWTVVHPIDEGSPLLGCSHADLVAMDVELLVLVQAFDDNYGQTVHTRLSYKANEIVWGARFTPVFEVAHDGYTHLHLHRIGAYEASSLPAVASLPQNA